MIHYSLFNIAELVDLTQPEVICPLATDLQDHYQNLALVFTENRGQYSTREIANADANANADV